MPNHLKYEIPHAEIIKIEYTGVLCESFGNGGTLPNSDWVQDVPTEEITIEVL